MEPRQLSPRQARWVELLSTFRFKIVYRPGKYATMPDALSRRADYHPGKGATVDHKHNFVQALPSISKDQITSPIQEGGKIFLRALQRVVAVDRDYFIDDQDIKEGIRLDPDLTSVVADMCTPALVSADVSPQIEVFPIFAKLLKTLV